MLDEFPWYVRDWINHSREQSLGQNIGVGLFFEKHPELLARARELKTRRNIEAAEASLSRRPIERTPQ